MKDRQGSFWKVDQKGYLINDADLSKVQPEFLKVFDSIKEVYIKNLGSLLHSCYLTGSVPRGLAIEGVSDMDAFAVLKKGKSTLVQEAGLRKELLNVISEECYPEFIDIQTEIWKWDDVFHAPQEFVTEYQAILKLNSLCLFGKNLSHMLPPIKPDIALANTEVIQFKSDVEEALNAISINSNPENVRFWCKKIIKNLIRVGFYMTIPLEKKFTRDLSFCIKIFLKYYPEKIEMDRCLDILLHPFSSAFMLEDYFKIGFGCWVLEETERWLDKYNPKRLPFLKR